MVCLLFPCPLPTSGGGAWVQVIEEENAESIKRTRATGHLYPELVSPKIMHAVERGVHPSYRVLMRSKLQQMCMKTIK
jgi:hypothetical protein